MLVFLRKCLLSYLEVGGHDFWNAFYNISALKNGKLNLHLKKIQAFKNILHNVQRYNFQGSDRRDIKKKDSVDFHK